MSHRGPSSFSRSKGEQKDLPFGNGMASGGQGKVTDVEEMGLAEALRELAIVTDELAKIDALVVDDPRCKSGLSGKQDWLKARKVALQARVQRG